MRTVFTPSFAGRPDAAAPRLAITTRRSPDACGRTGQLAQLQQSQQQCQQQWPAQG